MKYKSAGNSKTSKVKKTATSLVGMFYPFSHWAAGLATKVMTGAISSGVPNWLFGFCFEMKSITWRGLILGRGECRQVQVKCVNGDTATTEILDKDPRNLLNRTLRNSTHWGGQLINIDNESPGSTWNQIRMDLPVKQVKLDETKMIRPSSARQKCVTLYFRETEKETYDQGVEERVWQ